MQTICQFLPLRQQLGLSLINRKFYVSIMPKLFRKMKVSIYCARFDSKELASDLWDYSYVNESLVIRSAYNITEYSINSQPFICLASCDIYRIHWNTSRVYVQFRDGDNYDIRCFDLEMQEQKKIPFGEKIHSL